LSFYENHDIKKIIDVDKMDFDLNSNYSEYKNTIYQIKSTQIMRYNKNLSRNYTKDYIFFEMEYLIPVLEKIQIDDLIITWNPLIVKRNGTLYNHEGYKVKDSCDVVIEKVFSSYFTEIKKMLNYYDLIIKKIILKKTGYKFICDDNYGFEIENGKVGKIEDYSQMYNFNFIELSFPCSYYNFILDSIKDKQIINYDKLKNKIKIKCSNAV
jgi:hypothetical protein